MRHWTDIVAAAEVGEWDCGGIADVADARQISEMSHMRVTPVDLGYLRLMWINMARVPFDDVRVRKALL